MNGAATLRACQNCSKSKAKCIPQADPTDEKCERCSRLSKECVFALRTTRKRKSPSTHLNTAQLEEKIENLAALLAVQHKAVASSLSLPPEIQRSEASSNQHINNTIGSSWNPAPLSVNSKETWTSQSPATSSSEVIAHGSDSSLATGAKHPASSSLNANTSLVHNIPIYEENTLLTMFRERFSPRFPFVVIPSSVSASELKTQSPWLLHAIMAVADYENPAKQSERFKTVISEINIAMLVRGEISIDILQSLIMFNAWYCQLSPKGPARPSTALNQLLIAALYDLALNRPVQDKPLPADILNENIRDFPEKEAKDSKRSTEDRRALLSIYFLTSVLCWSFKRIDGLQHSPYIEYCAKCLLEASESEHDIVLAALVRMQSMIENANRVPLNAGAGTPVWMYVKASRLELQTYWGSLSEGIRQNRILIAHYHSAELLLLEPCLRKAQFAKTPRGACPERLDMLYAGLTSAKILCDLYINQPLDAYISFSIIDLACISCGLATLFKLSFVDEYGWDISFVRQIADFPSYIERCYKSFEQVGLALDQGQAAACTPCFQTRCAQKMKMVKAWFDVHSRADINGNSTGVQDMSIEIGELEDVYNSDLFSDGLWEHLMAEANF